MRFKIIIIKESSLAVPVAYEREWCPPLRFWGGGLHPWNLEQLPFLLTASGASIYCVEMFIRALLSLSPVALEAASPFPFFGRSVTDGDSPLELLLHCGSSLLLLGGSEISKEKAASHTRARVSELVAAF